MAVKELKKMGVVTCCEYPELCTSYRIHVDENARVAKFGEEYWAYMREKKMLVVRVVRMADERNINFD